MFQPLGGSSRDPLFFSRFALLKVPLPAPDRLGEVEHAKPGYTALGRAYFPHCNLSLASIPSKIHVFHYTLGVYLSGNQKKKSLTVKSNHRNPSTPPKLPDSVLPMLIRASRIRHAQQKKREKGRCVRRLNMDLTLVHLSVL